MKAFLVPCILVENAYSAGIKLNYHAFHWVALCVPHWHQHRAWATMHQSAELCRAPWRFFPGFLLPVKRTHRHTSWGHSGIAQGNKAAMSSSVHERCLTYSTWETKLCHFWLLHFMKRKNLDVLLNLAFKSFFSSFLMCYSLSSFSSLLYIVTFVITMNSFWFLVCFCNTCSGCANLLSFPKWKIGRRVQLDN